MVKSGGKLMLSSILNNLTPLFSGTKITLTIWLSSLLISITMGTILGVVESSKSDTNRWLQVLTRRFTQLIRALPFYLQLLIIYFAIPIITTLNISSLAASIISLGICSSAYVSQIIKQGINNYQQSLWEMALLLGYTKKQALLQLVLPEVFRSQALSLNGEIDQLIKSTAVCSTIGVLEIMGVTRNVIAREMNPVSMYLNAALIFIVISYAWNTLSAFIQERIKRA
ncbi:ABC transporter permease subunit [Candidatus Dependentiae bacterium]|nr:ABC transporter permease subunit [Candidatus Dependentiae bacterium]